MTPVALEVLCALMVYQDLEVVEIALAVVAPRPCKQLIEIRSTLLLVAHVCKVLLSLGPADVAGLFKVTRKAELRCKKC